MGDNNQSTGRPGQCRAIATAVSAVLAGPHAAAQAQQQQDQTRAPVLEEIIVTATKREANLQDVAQSITAFTGAEIQRRGFEDLDDYAAFIPSLSFATREPGGTSIIFRGVAASGLEFDADSSAAIYLDEQPITSGGLNPDPRLIDIARLEALSGPQGTLFGASSQSGTLRIITNKPDTVEPDGWIDLGTNTVEDGDVGLDISAMANVPLIENRLGLRLVGFYSEEAGFIDNVLSASAGDTFDNSNLLEEDVNSVEYAGGRAMLRWNLNDDWTTDIVALFQEVSADGFTDVNFDAGDLEQIRFENEESDDEWYQVGITLQGSTGFADALVSLSYFERDFRYAGDASDYEFAFNQLSIAYGVPAYDFGGDPRGFAIDDQHDERVTLEARLNSDPTSDSRWQWLIGLFYNDQEQNDTFDSFVRGYTGTPAFAYFSDLQYAYTGEFLPPTERWFLGRYDESLEEAAVFGELGFDVTENFTITAGGRWFQFDREFNLHQEAPQNFVGFTLVDSTAQSDGDDFVGKLNLTYTFPGGNLIYFTWSEGFRNGGSNPLRPNSVLPRDYEPDLLTNHEAGFKTEWLDGRLRFNMTAFFMDWEDIQLQVNDPQDFVFALGRVNLGDAEINGVEVEFSALVGDNLTITSSGSYIDAESTGGILLLDDPSDPANPFVIEAEDGAQLPLSPEWKATLGIEYNFPTTVAGMAPFLRFDYAYVGDAVNSLGAEAAVFPQSPNDLEAYQIGDFKIGLEAERWSLTFFVDNVWDERAQQFVNNRWGRPRLSINRPRTIGGTLRYSFR